MKKKLLLILVICVSYANAQKKNIDVDLLSSVISAKQDELKTRVLSNLVVKKIKTTNYTTYYTIYNLLDIIITEKNKTVMTQSLVRQIADYSLVMGLTDFYIKKHDVKFLKDTSQDLKLKDISQDLKLNFYTPAPGTTDFQNLLLVNSNFTKLMKTAYYDESKSKSTNSEEFEPKPDLKNPDSIYLIKMNSLLANFLIDTAYQVLRKKPTLIERGFFKKDPQRQFFSFGLDIEYYLIREYFRKNPDVIKDFVNFLNACEDDTYEDEVIGEFVQNKNIQFKDFGKDTANKELIITKEKIGLLMDLFNEAISTFRGQIRGNNFIATIGDIISKHVILDFSDYDQEKIYEFKIDVEAIILALVDKFYANSLKNNYRVFWINWLNIGIKPFFTIGLNYGYFVDQKNSFNFDNTSKSLSQITLASEKLGVKFIFSDYKYKRSHPPLEWYKFKGTYRRWKKPVPKPLINNFYGMIYGSGLLYNIVDLKSEKNFKYGITGIGLGIEFFNGLELNLSYAMPIIPDVTFGRMLNNGFINLGFDIPIFEYLTAAKNKR